MIVHRIAVRELGGIDPLAWRDGLTAARREGARVVTLYGQRRDDRVAITAVIETPGHVLHASRTEVVADVGYPELTSEWPALHCFERELHEQTGLPFANHPWLKPLRFEGRDAAIMDGYPFYRLAGKEVHEVAVGPIHAGVIEPGAFRFSCYGEIVHHLEIHLGYQHRGVERRLLEGDPRRRTPLVETIAGDTTVAYAWAHAAAIEALAGVELAPEIEIARAVALELERVAMHLSGLAGLAADLGFVQAASTYGRLRTTAINTTMRLCGSRFGRGAVRPGGVGMELDDSLTRAVEANLTLLRDDLAIIDELFLGARTVQHRLRRVGVLGTARALELGIVGLAARASGVALDARAGGAYTALPVDTCGFAEGDCFARASLRIAELGASLAWLSAMVATAPGWSRSPQLDARLAPSELAIAVVEGWRGEVVHCIETGTEGELVHYKVQDPSLRNWMGLAIALRGNEISDFPICNKSFDLSYCGHDL